MRIFFLLLIFIPIVSFSQNNLQLVSSENNSTLTDCPTWDKKSDTKRGASYYNMLRKRTVIPKPKPTTASTLLETEKTTNPNKKTTTKKTEKSAKGESEKVKVKEIKKEKDVKSKEKTAKTPRSKKMKKQKRKKTTSCPNF